MDNILKENKFKRTKEIKIRLNQKEYLELMKKKDKYRLAEWIRNTCLEYKETQKEPIRIKVIPEEISIEFSKIGSNINQLAYALNLALRNSDDIELKETCGYIRNHLILIENYLNDIRVFLLVRDSNNDF